MDGNLVLWKLLWGKRIYVDLVGFHELGVEMSSSEISWRTRRVECMRKGLKYRRKFPFIVTFRTKGLGISRQGKRGSS